MDSRLFFVYKLFFTNDLAQVLGYEKPRNAIAAHVDADDALKWGLTEA